MFVQYFVYAHIYLFYRKTKCVPQKSLKEIWMLTCLLFFLNPSLFG